MGIKDILTGGVVKAAGEAFGKRTERKMAKESAVAKLAQTKLEGSQQVTFNDQELEHINTALTNQSWKDEYLTVSFGSIINLFVLGGILAAFGYPQLLDGVVTGVERLVQVGVDMGFLIQAVVLAGIGLTIWRKA